MIEEILTWIMAFLFATLVVGLHIRALRYVRHIFVYANLGHPWHIFFGTAFILMLHLVAVVLNAGLYYVICEILSIGKVVYASTLRDYFYFSAVSYTSLGYGDLYPTGIMRPFAAIESIVGLSMIGWTVTFSYQYAMRK